MNDTYTYMREHNWKNVNIDNRQVYFNGKLYVFCNMSEYKISKTPDNQYAYTRGYKNMLTAFKNADKISENK